MTLAPALSFRQKMYAMELAPNTRVAYGKGWQSFEDFCLLMGIEDPLDADEEVVAKWLLHISTTPSKKGLKPLHPGTVKLYRSGVNKAFEISGRQSPGKHPLVNATMKAVCRDNAQPARQAQPLREYHIEAMLRATPRSLIGYRDAAVIALGFSAALRRSELVGLNFDDIEFIDEDDDQDTKLIVHIRQSKTDQFSQGQQVPVINGKRIRPVSRLRRWLRSSSVREGPLFRTMKRGDTVRRNPLHSSDYVRLIKFYAQQVGIDPATVSGHSLRAGFVTSAASHRARLDKIMSVTRHTSIDMVMKYTRDADIFDDHAGASFL